MTTLTLATLAVVVYGVLGRQGYGRALALGGSTVAGAAVVVGSVAVPTFYAVAIGAAVAIALRTLGQGRSPRSARTRLPPGVGLLLLFLGWSVLVTVVAPQLFDGQRVLVPTGADDAHLTAGVLTSSNFAQIIYLVLGVCVVVFLARSTTAGPQLIGLAVGLTVLLSFWRYLNQQAGVPFPEGVFDNSPFFAYIETAAGGLHRFRGILSEPSSLAASCLVAVSYMVSRAPKITGARRWGAWTIAVIAGYLGTISTSASFIVAAVAVVLIAGLTFLVSFLSRQTSVSALVSLLTCALVVAALWVLPIVGDFVQSVVDEKVSSSSFSERSDANTVSYDIFLDTFGVGVGLGGSRASSFFAGLLSTTGIVGTLLLASVIVTLIRRSAPVVEYRPVAWALVTLLVLKIVAGPDLSDNSGVFWMALGLLSRAALIAEGRRAAVASPDSVTGPAQPVPDRRSDL
jgi:hypothetical protein